MTPDKSNYVTEITEEREPDRTYIMGDKTMQGSLYGNDAIRQAVHHILACERYSNPIYGDDYGVELNKYIGSSLEYIKSTIYTTLKEALTQDDRITDVSVLSVEKPSVDSCTIIFEVTTIYGKQQGELEIVQ